MNRRKELENYLPPLTKKERELRKKLTILDERVNSGKPTLMRREDTNELR